MSFRDNSRFHFYIDRCPRKALLEFFLFRDRREPDGIGRAVALPITFTEASEGDPVEPFFTLPEEFGQDILDSLYRAGYRPSDEIAERSGMESMKRHLDDMRVLVAHKMKIELPK